VLDVEDRLVEQVSDVRIVERVDHAPAAPFADDEAEMSQHAQLVRNSRALHLNGFGELVYVAGALEGGGLLRGGWGIDTYVSVRSVLLRRFGPVGVALTVFDLWRRVPKNRRIQLRRGAARLVSRHVRVVVPGLARFAKGLR
jgi:hypothetical protein